MEMSSKLRAAAVGSALAIAVAGCGASGGEKAAPKNTTTTAIERTTTTKASTTTTEDEQAEGVELDEGETPELLAELVDVPGYFYEDVDDQERQDQLDAIGDSVEGVTFHWVMSQRDGQEVGWLQLGVPDPLLISYAPGQGEEVAKIQLDTESVAKLDLAGQEVWYAEDPGADNGYRYRWTWLRHGTVGYADATERAPMEAFLEAYFDQPYNGPEGPVLGSRIVDLPDYAYTDALEPPGVTDLAGTYGTKQLSDHYVYDRDGAFATLVVMGPTDRFTTDELARRTLDQDLTGAKDLGDEQVGTFTVRHLRLPADAATSDVYLWQWKATPVVGVLVVRPGLDTARADAFVKAFLEAQTAT